jgi:hypothetical protein
MKKQILNTLYLSITFIAFIFISCSKDKPCNNEVETLNISDEDRYKVPYKDSTKLTFISLNTNDTHTFVGQGWKMDYGYYSESGAAGCPKQYNFQRKYIQFVSTTFTYPITISLLYYYPLGDYMEVKFNRTTFVARPISLSKPYTYDSLIIQNKIFFDIKYFKNQYKPENNTKYGCYYNITEGIVKVETYDDDVWELLKIE